MKPAQQLSSLSILIQNAKIVVRIVLLAPIILLCVLLANKGMLKINTRDALSLITLHAPTVLTSAMKQTVVNIAHTIVNPVLQTQLAPNVTTTLS